VDGELAGVHAAAAATTSVAMSAIRRIMDAGTSRA
jgi:hypothetical protein